MLHCTWCHDAICESNTSLRQIASLLLKDRVYTVKKKSSLKES